VFIRKGTNLVSVIEQSVRLTNAQFACRKFLKDFFSLHR